MSGARNQDRPGAPAPAGSPEPSLAPTVDRLRDEVEGLRHALRSRSIIEQAKGMLMERYGCTPDEAFERLARLSQHANVKLADVASALVEASLAAAEPPRGPAGGRRRTRGGAERGAPARPVVDLAGEAAARWPRQGSGEGEFGARIRDLARGPRTRAELLAARDPQDILAAVVRTGLSHRPPNAAVLVALDVNGVVTLLASHGMSSATAARWRTFPLDLDLPVCRVLRTGRADWLTRPEGGGTPGDAAERAGPALGLGLPEDWSTVAAVPLGSGGGALVLVWARGGPTDPDDRAEVERLAAAAAVSLGKLPHPAPGRLNPRWVPSGLAADPTLAVLDALWHPVLVCEPVAQPDGAVVDFRVVHLNPAAADQLGPGRDPAAGRRLLEISPDSVDNGLFAACRRVVATGAQVDLPGLGWRLASSGRVGRETVDVRLTRYRGGVLLTWAREPVTEDRSEAGERT